MRPNGNEKVTGLPESGALARDGHTEPVSDGRRRIEEDDSMEPWKGSPKPTMPTAKPASSPTKPGQTQPSSMNKTSSTTKKPTGKK